MKHARRTDQPATGGTAPTTQAPAVPPQRTAEGAHHAEPVRDEPVRDERVGDEPVRDERVGEHEHERAARDDAHDKYGGMNIGAAFFGWLVAIGVAALLIGIVSAVLTAIGSGMQLNQADARQNAGGYGLAAAITLAVVLFVAYYAGGYVAGRMSRFDGARQGLGVWIVGLVITIVVAAIAAVAGSQYDVFSRVQLPSIPLSSSTATWGGIITLAAILILTAVGAVLGGMAGHRYHTKVDRAAGLR